MGEVKMTFHKYYKRHFYGTAYAVLYDVCFSFSDDSRTLFYNVKDKIDFLFWRAQEGNKRGELCEPKHLIRALLGITL